ncbi:MAG TPA: bifunctional YncE family protein/alkaline phosphatase family protein [Bryobacteraceae bacterium]|nr:bifunctional YncE family protein/alkaline phosphatase family protein [Bryobacteraceae bacterium]
MRKLALTGILVAAAVLVGEESGLFPVLRSTARIGRHENGVYLLPTSQLLHPWGEQAAIKGRPVDLAFDSTRRLLAILNSHSVLLVDGTSGARMAEIQSRSTSYTGVVFRPGDRELWVSEAREFGPDSLLVVHLSELGAVISTERISLAPHPLPAGIAFSSDGKTAYVALSRNNSLALIDANTKQIEREVPVGIAPFGVAIAPKRGWVFVTNRGGRRPTARDTVAPSSGSMIATDPVMGTSVSGTVTAVGTKSLSTREIPVGLAPSGIAVSPDDNVLAVANGHSDSISLIDTKTLRATEVKIPTWPEGTLGSMPIAVAFAPDGQTVYVACGGNNAIAVVKKDGSEWKLAGSLPTGWFPSGIAIDQKGALHIINIKGVGNTADGRGSFNSLQYEGSLTTMPAPAEAQIAAGTREVIAANSPHFEPAGGVANLSSLGIKHVFFIIKENRTYDQVFGDIPKGNGDPKLCFYGQDVTPNEHALAERYVLLDNFHTGGAISFDGHSWLMQAFVSDYIERAFAASPRGYAWNMSDALAVSPAGFFWQSSKRPLDVRIYGEFGLPARWNPEKQNTVDMKERDLLRWSAYWKRYREGKWEDVVGERPGVPALGKFMSRRYPYNSTSIPDQIRAEEYLRELAELEKTGQMPNLSIITLTTDHTNGTQPGSPTPRAMVADNDLAFGRIVEGISKSRFWPQSLILAVEDDAQDGLDHVDGYRTVALAIGPHVRRDAVDSNFYTHESMVRTIQDIFEIPPRTRFASNARAMTSIFTPDADTSPYTCLPEKMALDEMNPPLNGLSGRKLWAAQQSLAMNWSHPDDIRADVLNRILWWDAKGYEKPYPENRDAKPPR